MMAGKRKNMLCSHTGFALASAILLTVSSLWSMAQQLLVSKLSGMGSAQAAAVTARYSVIGMTVLCLIPCGALCAALLRRAHSANRVGFALAGAGLLLWGIHTLVFGSSSAAALLTIPLAPLLLTAAAAVWLFCPGNRAEIRICAGLGSVLWLLFGACEFATELIGYLLANGLYSDILLWLRLVSVLGRAGLVCGVAARLLTALMLVLDYLNQPADSSEQTMPEPETVPEQAGFDEKNSESAQPEPAAEEKA